MGLDTSHGCWHGAYSAFMRWRQKLAEVAGMPPLMLMEGFFDPKEWWCYAGPAGVSQRVDLIAAAGEDAMMGGGPWMSRHAAEGVRGLPISWDIFAADPLVKLLYHSDCEGELETADCGPIADRLAELLPKLPNKEAGGHIGHWHVKTQTFIDGLRAAATAGENVEFH